MDEKNLKQKDLQNKTGGLSSIKTKLILAMLLVCAVPLAIATAISYLNANKTAQESAEALNSEQVNIVESEFTGLLNRNISAIQAVAATPSMKEYLSAPAPVQASKFKEIQAFLQMIDRDLGDENPTVLISPKGQQMVSSQGKLVNVTDRDYYQEAMNGETYVSDVLISKINGGRIIVPAVPIKAADDDTVILGVITRLYDIGYLHAFLANEADANSRILICGRDGAVVADSDHEILPEDELEDRSGAEFFTRAQAEESGTYISNENGKKVILSFKRVDVSGWVIVLMRDYDATMASARQTSLIIVLIGVVMLIAASVIALKMASSFTKPVAALNETLNLLADGEFKQVHGYASRKDEFGKMIGAANRLIEKLGDIVEEIKHSAEQVNSSSEELAESAGQMAITSEDVARAVQEIATGAGQQADEIQNATESTGSISENIRNVTEQADHLAETAGGMNSNSTATADQMKRLEDTTQEMSTAIDDITEKIGSTGEAVERISKKVSSINSIASQTNLLALNASIEAARAGEAGRGFAVVAEEIGHLADDSSHTATEIRKEMEMLLEESQQAIQQAGEVRKATELQREVLAGALQSIEALIEDINRTVAGVESIRIAAEECDASKTVVSDVMSSLSAISEENAAASEETSASMEEMSATVNNLAGTAEELKRVSERLTEEMKFFK